MGGSGGHPDRWPQKVRTALGPQSLHRASRSGIVLTVCLGVAGPLNFCTWEEVWGARSGQSGLPLPLAEMTEGAFITDLYTLAEP